MSALFEVLIVTFNIKVVRVPKVIIKNNLQSNNLN